MNSMTLYLTPNDIGIYTTTHGVTVEVEVAYNLGRNNTVLETEIVSVRLEKDNVRIEVFCMVNEDIVDTIENGVAGWIENELKGGEI